MTRPPAIRAFLGDGVIADNFAGGGGASSGIELALGRSPDIAINHDAEAIAMHAANHPTTEHYTESVWEVDPVKACGGKPVALAWFSPDCKHFSKAKGGKPREQKIRGLAWVAVRWARAVKPRVIALENVEEFREWGPLVDNKPCPKRRGKTFRAFVRKLEGYGYVVEHRLLRACDYGAPTTRRRLFLIARCDGRPIVWPVPSHGPGRAAPHRTAAECIDWSIPCPSIFDRGRPLADKTLARIARGVRKYVIESARPFLVHLTHGTRDHSLEAPVPTVTGNHRGELALVTPYLMSNNTNNVPKGVDEPVPTVTTWNRNFLCVPYLVHRSNGERVGQAPRIYDADKPLGTIVAQGQKHALCTAFLARHFSERPGGSWVAGAQVDLPLPTVTAKDHHALVAANLVRYNGDKPGAERVADLAAPMSTLDTSNRMALVHAFLVRYNGTSSAEGLQLPLGTLTARDRYGLVTVTIDGEEYVIVDIGMRMLTPRELFRAQGFPDWSVSMKGRAWRDRTDPAAGDPLCQERKDPASPATRSSSPGSVPESDRRAAVHALIDLGRNVLELRNLERSSSAVSDAAPLASFPLPTPLADSARLLAPMGTCVARETPVSRAATPTSNQRSTSRPSGGWPAGPSGSATADGAVGATGNWRVSLEPAEGMPSTTSQGGPSSPMSDSTTRTLCCSVADAIGSSILAQTLVGNSFGLEIEVRHRYQIEPMHRGKKLTKTAQVRMCGNSVCPPLAAAVVRAQMEAA